MTGSTSAGFSQAPPARQIGPLLDAARRSAVNLIHDLALRDHDLRDFQDGSTAVGLSPPRGASGEA